MTYCAGLLVEEGLALIADTRTNAGVDNISTYKKLHIFETPGDRTLGICTAGNLSVTQTALGLLREGIRNPETEQLETLDDAPSMFRAAQMIGNAVRQVRTEIKPTMEAESVSYGATLLLGGQIKNGPLSLFMIYGQGNFIECRPDTPYLQIGECKYGKPILDRSLKFDTPLADAVKTGLLSFDSTMRSNLAVGLPIDVMVIPRETAPAAIHQRIDHEDPYFRDLGERWSRALREAQNNIPTPPFLDKTQGELQFGRTRKLTLSVAR